jgi:predicted nucleic acid-binding protein
MPPTFVLDTNVLVAGLRSSLGASFELLRRVGTGQFDVGLTTPLVLEYEAVCTRLEAVPDRTPEEVGEVIDYLCSVGKQAAVRYRVRPAAADPGDDLVLEAAVATGSGVIVSHNVRDMADGARQYGIEVITPGEALRRLEETP